MAKSIKVKPIPSIEEGLAIQIPELDENGIGIMDGRKPKTRDGTIIDILEGLLSGFPREKLTMDNITEGVKLKNQLNEAKKKGTLILDEFTYVWVIKMLKDEQVGVKMLAFNLPAVLKAVE